MSAHRTVEAAQRRVDVLRRSGIWPGIIARADGTFALTYDPGDAPASEGED